MDPLKRLLVQCSSLGLLLLRALKGQQEWVVFRVRLLLVVEVKHLIFFNGHHFSVINCAVVVSVQDANQFLELFSGHGNASFLDASHELRPGDLLVVVFVELAEEVHHTQTTKLDVFQQEVQNILAKKKTIGNVLRN